jgi:hypothetical protein
MEFYVLVHTNLRQLLLSSMPLTAMPCRGNPLYAIPQRGR